MTRIMKILALWARDVLGWTHIGPIYFTLIGKSWIIYSLKNRICHNISEG